MEIFKTWCEISSHGWTSHHAVDTVIIDEIPHLVFEWKETPDGKMPAVTVPLDPKRLYPVLNDNATHLYELVIQDPRRDS
jgi:hypothetical protein